MHLADDEKVLKVFYHHYFPFAIRLAKVVGASIPFYFILFLFAGALSNQTLFLLNLLIVSLFLLVVLYVTFVYWLDRLVITNKRAVYIDWKYLTLKSESEAKLEDVQDIRTKEKGILAALPFLDYGVLTIKTASDRTVIEFPEAPNPEGIRTFIYHVRREIM